MKDYLLLLDENERLKRIINDYEFYDDEIKSTTSGERVFTFKMNDSVVDIENGNKIGVFAEGKFDLFIVDQIEAETYYSTSIKVTCLHDFYSIQTQKAITQYYRESISLRDAMTEMLKGTSYELGECVERALISIGPYLYKNPLWCIQDIISNFGVEIDYSIELNETRTGITRKLVHVVNALGSDTGIRCSTDLNVSKIKRVQKDKFYTVMYGCGSEYQKDLVKYKYDFKDVSWSTSNGNPTDKPSGQEFVEDKKAIAKYGRIIGIFEDGRIKDPELLLKKTWEALQKNNRPIVSYELDIEELKNEDGYEHLNFKLGDIIILQNTIDNSRAKFRIVEDCKSIRNKNKRKVTVGEQLKGIFSGGNSGNSDGTEGPGGSVIDPGGEEIKPPSLEEITPDTLPAVPVVTANGLWKSVQLSWTYESKMYYNYEVYASKIKDFEPTVFHMIYNGKASAFLHEVEAKETWYYRVRAVNTFGNATEFSGQVEATTTKVEDGTAFFESAAIKDALIEELRLDRGWIGTLRGHYIDARELSVTDGNGKRTLDIDSFGNVNIVATNLSMIVDGQTQGVAAQSSLTQLDDKFEYRFNKSCNNLVINSTGKSKNMNPWTVYRYSNATAIKIQSANTQWTNWEDAIQIWTSNIGTIDGGAIQKIKVTPNKLHTLVCYIAGHRSDKQVVVTNKANNIQIAGSKVYGNINGGTAGPWEKVVLKFTPTEDEVNIRLKIARGENYDAYFWCKNLYVVEGDFPNLEWRPNQSEVMNNITNIDSEGIKVQHDSGAFSRFDVREMYQSNENGDRTISMRNGGLRTYQFRNEGNGASAFLGGISSTRNHGSDRVYGNSIFGSSSCGYVDIGFSESGEDNQHQNIMPWLRCTHYDGNTGVLHGIHAYKNLYVRNWSYFYYRPQMFYGMDFPYEGRDDLNVEKSFISTSANPSPGTRKLYICGADGVQLLVQNSGDKIGHQILEEGSQVGLYHQAWGNWDMNGWSINNVRVTYSLSNPVAKLSSKERKFTRESEATMSTIPLIQDRGEDFTMDGQCIVEIPDDIKYNIGRYDVNIIKYGRGDIWVSERTLDYFVVESDNDIKFTWVLEGELLENAYRTSTYNELYNFEEVEEEPTSTEIIENIPASRYALMDDEQIEYEMYLKDLKENNQLWKLYEVGE